MPTKQSRLTKTEDQEYRARLVRLGKMGLTIGSAGHPLPAPDRIILEQISQDFGRIYDLPSGAVAVVAPAKLNIPISGIVPTDCVMMIPWDDFPLELSDPNESKYYQTLIDDLPHHPTELLNRWLTSKTSLRCRQAEGVIVAEGWTRFPPELHDEMPVTVELLLADERDNEMCFAFRVRVDRSLKRRYEQQQRERQERVRLTKPRGGLYDGGQLGDQKSVSPTGAVQPRHPSGDDDAELKKPN